MKLPIELKRRYLDRRLEDIRLVMQKLEHGDFSEALRVGHQVKGNAVTFEVPQIASIGTEMESAAKRKDAKQVRLLIQRMEILLKGADREV